MVNMLQWADRSIITPPVYFLLFKSSLPSVGSCSYFCSRLLRKKKHTTLKHSEDIRVLAILDLLKFREISEPSVMLNLT